MKVIIILATYHTLQAVFVGPSRKYSKLAFLTGKWDACTFLFYQTFELITIWIFTDPDFCMPLVSIPALAHIQYQFID